MFIFSPLYADVTNGLVGWWKFDEASGNALDSSGNSYTATATGTTVLTSGCKRGKCRNFDGSADYLDVGTVIVMNSGGITLSTWIKSSDIGQNKAIVSKRYITAGDWMNYLIGTSNTANYLIFFDFTVGNGVYHRWDMTSTASALGILDGRWHLLSVSYTFGTGSSIKFYVDGVSVSGSWATGDGNSLPSSRHASERLTIGSTTGGASKMAGVLDDVRIYNRALTETEIKAIYLSGNPQIIVRGSSKINGMKMD